MLELICTAFFLLASSGSPNAQAQEANDLDEESLSAAIESERLRQEAVGVAVGIVRDGQLVWQGHFGFEDRQNKVPVTKDTMFRWASISKPLTAIVAAQLAITGALDLDADLRTHVPEFPEHATPITTRQLLGHLGGIVHYSNGPVVRTKRVYDSPHPFTDVVLALDKFKESPLVDEPGNNFHYSTHGFILASAVVQRAGDAPFRDQVAERIATTLKLDTLQPDDQFREIPHRAIGYARRAGRIIPSTNNDVAWKLGGGGFISTIGDLARFAAGLCNEDFMTDELKAILFSEQRTSKGEPHRLWTWVWSFAQATSTL